MCVPGEKGHKSYIYNTKDRLKDDRFEDTDSVGWHKLKSVAPERAIGLSDVEKERGAAAVSSSRAREQGGYPGSSDKHAPILSECAAMADLDPFPEAIPWIVNTLVWAIMTGVVSRSYNRKYADASCRHLLSFSPSSPAFGMWFVIWAAVVVSVGTQAVLYASGDEDAFAPSEASALLSGAFAMACLWAPFFSDGSRGGYLVAAFALASCAVLATAASLVDSLNSSRSTAQSLLVHPAFALTAGWTCVAACLSVGIAAKAESDAEGETEEQGAEAEQCDYSYLSYNALSPNAKFPHEPTVVPFVLSVAVGATAAVVCDPVLPLPVAWGVFFMHPSLWNWAALVLLAASATVAAALS